MSDWYVLADDLATPIAIPSIMEDPEAYAAAKKNAPRGEQLTVARTTWPDGTKVSTVFLGLDYGGLSPHGAPVLWETMVFSYDHRIDLETDRYTSRADAEAGHKRMVAWVEAYWRGTAA